MTSKRCKTWEKLYVTTIDGPWLVDEQH